MEIRILVTESLGARGMCCQVKTSSRNILIDPGVALGFKRYGLLPHPLQIEKGARLRDKICAALQEATDIIFTHFHGDHIPLLHANPFQLSLKTFCEKIERPRLWAYKPPDAQKTMQRRFIEIEKETGLKILDCQQDITDEISLSAPVSHGRRCNNQAEVTMVCVREGNKKFVHASDIQLQEYDALEQIGRFKPDVLFVSGPPLYRIGERNKLAARAFEIATRLLEHCQKIIIDHHLLRGTEGISWLASLTRISDGRIMCGADFMNEQRCIMEAERPMLYKEHPVTENYHLERYNI